jgi:K+-sensing histidine kinase KdpD
MNQQAVIEVSDNGKGIPEKELKDIFHFSILFSETKRRWFSGHL